ncbi:HAD-like domain-containing protein [Epithele typhae]|uniref:HAD-like domain-containing protein n=1 Tax=Epithele typhae TaxID=378194 RepID=UPI002007B72F|nr:HAD-like domain-containing protein [Epithele typhae]KAH9912319.1 HAD-like domain-containing protein [Epithele typhae]
MTSEAAPESTLPYPPLHTDKKFVVLSDWLKRRQGNLDILAGKVTFRDAFREMLESISGNGHNFEFCKEELKKNITLDGGFKDFHKYCKEQDILGMEPSIRAVLSKLIGDDAKEIDIVSNNVDIHPDGTWSIKYRHPTSGFGHDKSQAILPYRRLPNPPLIFFFGDGVSDMSAARHADVLFVKCKDGGDNDLAAYCRREGIPHILFADFSHARVVVADIVEGRTTAAEALAKGKA